MTLGPFSPWNSPGQNTGVDSCSLLQGIFLTQGSNPGLPHCRQILYQLSRQGSSRILEWAAYPFCRGIFPTQESNWGLLHCRQILHQLSHQVSSLTGDESRATSLGRAVSATGPQGKSLPSPLELTTLMELLPPVPSTSDSTDSKAFGSKKEMLP